MFWYFATLLLSSLGDCPKKVSSIQYGAACSATFIQNAESENEKEVIQGSLRGEMKTAMIRLEAEVNLDLQESAFLHATRRLTRARL